MASTRKEEETKPQNSGSIKLLIVLVDIRELSTYYVRKLQFYKV